MYFVQSSDLTTVISEYFDFNGIEYNRIDLYDTSTDIYGYYNIPEILLTSTGNVLVLDSRTFTDLVSWNVSYDRLLQFLKNNTVVYFDNVDSLLQFNNRLPNTTYLDLDSKIRPGSIVYVLDGKLTDDHWGHQLVNSKIKIRPYSRFHRLYRIHHAGEGKNPNAYPYLITTVMYENRPHRIELYNQLKQKENLFNQGLCAFNDPGRTKWIGQAPSLNNWPDGYASMDLYKNAWLEVVPETMYKDGYFFTEKTAKPIVTKTPFLILSTPGYLNYLKSFGFKTFEHLISEKYDLEYDVSIRTKLLLEQLENIVNNGAEQFYNASLDVLEYNQKRLAEITGMWNLETDRFITQVLQEVDQ